MTVVHVDPLELLETAQRLAGVSMQLRALADKALEAGEDAPSYDGQLAPQVRGLGADIHSSLQSQIQRMDEYSAELIVLAEEFAKADQQSFEGIAQIQQAFLDWMVGAGLLSPDGTLPKGSLLQALVPSWFESTGQASSGDGEKPPWWGPLAQGAAEIWGWFDRSVGEPLRDMPMTWRGNLYNARIIALHAAAEGWFAYDRSVNQFIYDRVDTWKDNLAMLQMIWNEKLYVRQDPGLPADGPISGSLTSLSALDSSGNPVSVVGTELVGLIDERGGVRVMFSDTLTLGRNGVAPVKGLIAIPNKYMNPVYESDPANSLLVAHELAHVLQRDLPEFPDGIWPAGSWIFDSEGTVRPFAFETGSPIGGDFTLYMEVQSNIVSNAIEYDFLAAEQAQYPPSSPAYAALSTQMQGIADELATYTGDAAEAAAYVLQDYRHAAPAMYEGEMVREAIFGARIPPGGWQHWLAEQGFSDAAINHIRDIAQSGQAQDVWLSGMLDYDPQQIPPTSTPNPTPTWTPAPTPASSSTAPPTATPDAPFPTSTPTPDNP